MTIINLFSLRVMPTNCQCRCHSRPRHGPLRPSRRP